MLESYAKQNAQNLLKTKEMLSPLRRTSNVVDDMNEALEHRADGRAKLIVSPKVALSKKANRFSAKRAQDSKGPVREGFDYEEEEKQGHRKHISLDMVEDLVSNVEDEISSHKNMGIEFQDSELIPN